MKLSELDTKSGANHGAWLHLKRPDGELHYSPDGKTPTRVKVHGMECDAVKRERIKRDRANAFHNVDNYITQEEFGDNVLASLIIDFEGIEDDDGNPLEPTMNNKRKFINLSEDINRQVLAFARDRTNFFSPPA